MLFCRLAEFRAIEAFLFYFSGGRTGSQEKKGNQKKGHYFVSYLKHGK